MTCHTLCDTTHDQAFKTRVDVAAHHYQIYMVLLSKGDDALCWCTYYYLSLYRNPLHIFKRSNFAQVVLGRGKIYFIDQFWQYFWPHWIYCKLSGWCDNT